MTANYAEMLQRTEIWILECAGERTGLLVLQPDGDQLLIYSLAIAPESQGKGHGRFLLQFAEREASRQKYACVRLYTNELMDGNVALYRYLGYQETHREECKGSNLVHMRKQVVR